MMAYVGHRSIADIQDSMFARLMRADLGFFHNTPTGQLISAFTNDAAKMRSLFSNTITGIGRDIVTVIGLVAAMFWIDWILSCVIFFVFPLVVVPVYGIGQRMRKVSANTQIEMAQFTTLQDESFQGIRHVKAYGMEDYEAGRASSLVARIFRLNYKAERVRAITEPLLEAIAGVAIAGVLVYGGYQVIAGARTPGDFGGFIAALLLAYDPVRRLARLNANLQEGLAAAERVFAKLDIEPEIVDRPGAKALALESGCVRLDNVEFAYDRRNDKAAPALGPDGRGVTLDVPAGKTVALVGPSGAGKTTVLNLIPRFYDVDSGAVLIDGQDVRDVTLASLRARIGLVSQETALFDDTIRANIAYGKQGATEGGDRRRRPGRRRPRLYHGDAAAIRHPGRRPRREGERRSAPAHLDCPRHPEGCADPAARRGDLGAGHGFGAPGAGRAGCPAQGPDDHRDRAPAVHHRRRRHRLCAGRWPGGGTRQPCRSRGGRRRVRPLTCPTNAAGQMSGDKQAGSR